MPVILENELYYDEVLFCCWACPPTRLLERNAILLVSALVNEVDFYVFPLRVQIDYVKIRVNKC